MGNQDIVKVPCMPYTDGFYCVWGGIFCVCAWEWVRCEFRCEKKVGELGRWHHDFPAAGWLTWGAATGS